MSRSWTRNMACLCAILLISAGLSACGSRDAQAPATGGALIRIELAGDGFAKGTQRTQQVEAGQIITLDVRADGGPFSLGVLAPSMAQTFKIPADGGQTITLSKLESGESAQLMVGDQTVRIVAAGTHATATDRAGSAPEPTAAAEAPAPPDQTSEANTVPVDVTLAGGGFAASTQRTVHVPAGFPITVTARARDDGSYRVRVVPAGAGPVLVVGPRGEGSVVLRPLALNRSLRLVVGGDSIKVVADAEPGP